MPQLPLLGWGKLTLLQGQPPSEQPHPCLQWGGSGKDPQRDTSSLSMKCLGVFSSVSSFVLPHLSSSSPQASGVSPFKCWAPASSCRALPCLLHVLGGFCGTATCAPRAVGSSSPPESHLSSPNIFSQCLLSVLSMTSPAGHLLQVP